MNLPAIAAGLLPRGSWTSGEPDTQAQVRQLIDLALSGQLKFPDGLTTPWRLRASRPAEVSAEETELAARLIRS